MNRRLIKTIRQLKGLSQLAFSEKLGVSRGLIAQVEAGYIKTSKELDEKIRNLVGDDFIKDVKKLIKE